MIGRSGLSDLGSTVAVMDELTDAEKAVLAFEARRWNHQGAKDTDVLNAFGLTPARYQQWVLHLIDKPAAYAHSPTLVKRLRRLQEERAGRRRPASRGLG